MVVVGAGPAGAATSILLAQQGYRVVLVDRAGFPRDKACAEYLSPACTPILERLGALAAVRAAAPQQLEGMRVTDYRGRACLGRFVLHGHPAYGLALPRRTFDHLLVEHACRVGVEVRLGFWVRQPLLRDRQVCGVVGEVGRRREALRAPLVIAADGLHSTLARRLRLIRRVRWPDHLAMVMHWQEVAPLFPWGEMFLFPGGYLGLAPVGKKLVNVSLVLRRAQLAACRLAPAQWVAAALQAHPELRRRFARAKPVRGPLVVGPLAQQTAWPRHGGILLVGDAAGFFDPFTGEGIFLALHGAELAAAAAHRALQRGDVSAAGLRPYFVAHRRAFAARYRLSALIQLGLYLPWLANAVIGRLAACPGAADTLVSVTGDLLPPGEVLSWRFLWRLAFPGVPWPTRRARAESPRQ
ncbi:MAG: geranylgeranyl hydrogenase BchP [Candidatus Tectimicrobiota bacterium]|nr:MAG: geranylgeranyl hydrogenase BchP [Candidatus Tectomicrobia bacterium]